VSRDVANISSPRNYVNYRRLTIVIAHPNVRRPPGDRGAGAGQGGHSVRLMSLCGRRAAPGSEDATCRPAGRTGRVRLASSWKRFRLQCREDHACGFEPGTEDICDANFRRIGRRGRGESWVSRLVCTAGCFSRGRPWQIIRALGRGR